jgi:hypothetical protein
MSSISLLLMVPALKECFALKDIFDISCVVLLGLDLLAVKALDIPYVRAAPLTSTNIRIVVRSSRDQERRSDV